MTTPQVHLFLSTDQFHPDLPGGLRRIFRNGPGLKARNVIAHAVTFRHRDDLPSSESVNDFRIHRFPPPASGHPSQHRSWLLQQALILACKARQQGHATVIQPTMLSHLMAPQLARARLAGIAVIHNLSIAPETPLHSTPLARLRQRLRMAVMCTPVSRCVFLSLQQMRQYRTRWPLRPKQCQVIPNGVDLTRFAPPETRREVSNFRSHNGIRDDQKVVLFVGGVMERKGVDILLRAWNAVRASEPNAMLAIVGSHGLRLTHDRPGFRDGLEAYLGEIEHLKSQLTEPGSVRFMGEVDDPAPYYKMADVFAFPSHREGLPNAVLEAMATGLPCLVAEFDGIPQDGEELGRSGQHHLRLGHDEDEWAQGLVSILTNDSATQRRTLGQQARIWIETHHDLSNVLDQWAQLYHETARPRHS